MPSIRSERPQSLRRRSGSIAGRSSRMVCVAPRSGTVAGNPGGSIWLSASSAIGGIGAPSDVRCSSAIAPHSRIPAARAQGAEYVSRMRSKDQVRRAVWRAMDREGVSRFPGAEGRIPNFAGAKLAAQKLSAHRLWKRAQVIKANPDPPQTHARRLALEDGKPLVMAVPQLRDKHLYRLLDPKHLSQAALREAATIKGALRHGRVVALEELPEIDFVLCGSVAVNLSGGRIGKGGGFSDLEYGLLIDAGKIDQHTFVATTVHPIQILREHLMVTDHDLPVDLIATPRAVVEVERLYKRPRGILWDHLQPPQLHEIPVLERMAYA